jgi:hypothetical protein
LFGWVEYFPLPTPEQREIHIKNTLAKVSTTIKSDEEIKELVILTDGYIYIYINVYYMNIYYVDIIKMFCIYM